MFDKEKNLAVHIDENEKQKRENKRLKISVIVLAFVSVVSLLTAIDVSHRADNFEERIRDLEMSFDCYDIEQEETPSIFLDYVSSFGTIKTASFEDGTIEYSISLTPLESTHSTSARVKINDKSYDLERTDNSFKGTMRVSMFEELSLEAILDDGTTIRSESLSGEDPYFNTAFSCYAYGDAIRKNSDGVSINQLLKFGVWEAGNLKVPEKVKVKIVLDDKIIYEKNLKSEYTDYEERGFILNDTIPLKGKKDAEIFVISEGEHGIEYCFMAGTLNRENDFINEEEQKIIVLDKTGKVLYEGEVVQ